MQWQGSCKKSKHRIYSLSNTAIVDPDLKVPAGFDVERLKKCRESIFIPAEIVSDCISAGIEKLQTFIPGSRSD